MRKIICDLCKKDVNPEDVKYIKFESEKKDRPPFSPFEICAICCLKAVDRIKKWQSVEHH